MATAATTWTREALAAAPQTYFDAVDAMDVDAVLEHFADDATLTVQTDHATFAGADEIRRLHGEFPGVRLLEKPPGKTWLTDVVR